MTAHLNLWFTSPDNPYAAPEQGGTFHLVGYVTGHPRLADGERIVTSTVVASKGREVTTVSGTVYRLGEPDPNWRKWMSDRGLGWDEAEPVKVVS